MIATLEQLNEVKNWLNTSQKTGSNGFGDQIINIEHSFNLNEMSCLTFENKTLGFATWRLDNRMAFIDLFEIHPEFRKQGLGKLFFEKLTSFLIGRGIYVVELKFISDESKAFWTKMGFLRYLGNNFEYYVKNRLYKILIESEKPIIGTLGNSHIEIWNDTRLSPIKPSLVAYNLNFINGSSGKLTLPIITPCNHDWTMKLNHNYLTIFLPIKKHNLFKYHPNFLIVESL